MDPLPDGQSSVGYKLPFWRTLAAAYGLIVRHPGRLLFLGYLPFLISVAALAPAAFVATRWTDHPELGLVLFLAVVSIMSVIVGVAWQRFVLLGRESHAVGFRLRFGSREAKHLGLVALTALPPAVWIGITVARPDWTLVTGAACVIATGAFSRFMLLFPAAALDEPLSLKASWIQTRGAALRIAALTIIPTLLYVGVLVTPFWLSTNPGGLLVTLLIPYILVHYVGWVAVVAGVTALSYLHLTGRKFPDPLVGKRLPEAPGGILEWTVDRDFGWLYISVMIMTAAFGLWAVVTWLGWRGVAAALIPYVAFVRGIIWRGLLLVEKSGIRLDEQTLQYPSRFALMTVYLKDIRDVSLRTVFGAVYVCLTFEDLDRALAHNFLVQRQTPPRLWLFFWQCCKLLGYIDLWMLVSRMAKGDFSVTYFGRQIDLYKEGEEQYVKDVCREQFNKHGFHLIIAPILRDVATRDLAREIDRRSRSARVAVTSPYAQKAVDLTSPTAP